MSDPNPKLTKIDHLVLTVSNIQKACEFYRQNLGMFEEKFETADGNFRWALKFGQQKINLHQLGAEFKPNAFAATSGSADICFLTETPVSEWIEFLETKGVCIEEGPVPRTGSVSKLMSIYLRDPDGNLVEIANQI